MAAQVRDEYTLWCEIRKLMDLTSKDRKLTFREEFPDIYHLYLTISANHYSEFKKKLEETKA